MTVFITGNVSSALHALPNHPSTITGREITRFDIFIGKQTTGKIGRLFHIVVVCPPKDRIRCHNIELFDQVFIAPQGGLLDVIPVGLHGLLPQSRDDQRHPPAILPPRFAKFLGQHNFFASGAQQEKRGSNSEINRRPCDIDQQGAPCSKDQPCVHRMAHNGIRSAGDQLVIV